LEQLICNLKRVFAHVFTELRTLLTLAVSGNRIRAALRRIAPFYSRNFADRRTDREKGVCARVWSCSSAITELKGMARARFEGTALVAAFVVKLVLK
jgi:hypothetical protein